ncbi:MAG: uroporphyrinogen-III synthase [Flavobacteriales bacterium]|jgi:uroporphyrinogen-III synthase
MAKILMTRPKGSSPNLLQKLEAAGHELLEFSFIKTEITPFDPAHIQEDWIFFSSKNAVKSCISAGVNLENYKLASVGASTSKILDPSLNILFEANSTDVDSEAKRFASTVGGASVCFPCSNRSLLTFAKYIPSSQAKVIEAYTTSIQAIGAPMTNVILFSSPSNVEGFLKLNIIMPSQKIIAFGPSTANYLKSQGIAVFKILDSTEEETIFSTIIEAIDSL